MQTTCKWCQNHFPEEEVKTHEANCGSNPDVQEKARKIGEIEKFKKTVVLREGKIVRMYWARSTGAQDFPIDPVLARWHEIFPKGDHHSVPFLKARGFSVVIT